MSEKGTINPFPVILPESLILGQLVAALGSFIRGTAWEIGERFDDILSQIHGPRWLIDTYGEHHTPNTHDPDFVFREHVRDEILWEALPPFSIELQERFKKARWTRNRWEHQTAKQNLNSFLNGVDQINRLAEPLGLKSASYAPLLIDRIIVLQKSGGVLPPTDSELEIQSQKEAAEDALSAAMVAKLQAEELGAQAAEALKAKKTAMGQVFAVRAEIERLESVLLEAGSRSRQSVFEPADGLLPGDPWGEIPLGVRTLTLKANMIDLMDGATQTLLSQQLGTVATEAARRWLMVMPSGGLVHLTPAGHAAGRVGVGFVYLGRLDTD